MVSVTRELVLDLQAKYLLGFLKTIILKTTEYEGHSIVSIFSCY